MKAILIRDDASHTLTWSEVPMPEVKRGEARIRICCAGVNRADLLQREGKYPPPPGAPEWMGLEVSGIIDALDAEAKTDFVVGDRVCCLLGGGGYAEYVTVPAEMLMPIPAGCTMEEAAAMPEAFATAYLNLVVEGGIKPGERVLVTGGNSGLASVMIPMAKALGASVYTSVRSREKAEAIRGLGADEIVLTVEKPLPAFLAEMEAKGTPIDLAIDCVGGTDVGECLQHMAYRGRWIMIAALAGTATQVELRVLYQKNVRLIGSTLRSRPAPFKVELMHRLQREIWPLAAQGKVRPAMFRTLPIEQADEAQALLKTGRSTGKVVLLVSEP